MSSQDPNSTESRTNVDDVTINMNNEPASSPVEEPAVNQSGSQRSLSLFPFRISRDLLLNNVSMHCFDVIDTFDMNHRLRFVFVLCELSHNCVVSFQYFSLIIEQVFQEIRPLVGRHSSSNAPFGWIRSSMQSDEPTNNSINTPNSETAPRSIDIESGSGGGDNVSIGADGPSYARQLSTSSAPARTDSVEAGSVLEVIDSATTATTATSNVISQSRASLHQQNANNSSYDSSTNGNGSNENEPANEADSLAQIPEARAFINTVSRYFPYVCILFAKSCYDHLDGEWDDKMEIISTYKFCF